MTTELLFRGDAYLKTASARVLAVDELGIELDRTIFYPQGGGQAGDTGVLLRENGSWPFYASWSTGLTEGAAMAVEYEYDGIFTLDEHAANILRLGSPTILRRIWPTGTRCFGRAEPYPSNNTFARATPPRNPE